VLLVAPGHLLAQWDYGVDIDLGAVRTDNVFLETEGAEESETVYMLAPVFYAKSEDQRLSADFRYAPQALFYSNNEDADSVFHSLDASMTSMLIELTHEFWRSVLTGNKRLAPQVFLWKQPIST
jgi:uncharacterized protein (PEP-CTERM system associated)